MAYNTEEKLKVFVDSFLPFDPPGIMINLGGYIDEIPPSIIAHCEEIKMPLIVFPWDIYLQDIMQEFTNMIFEERQKADSISNGFLNAVFAPEQKDGYEGILRRNGFEERAPFFVASVDIAKLKETEYYFLRRRIQETCGQVIFCKREQELILIFYGIEKDPEAIEASLWQVIRQVETAFPRKRFHVGIGDQAMDFGQLKNSYERAVTCRKLCHKKRNEIMSFMNLDILGILITSDRELLKRYYLKKLGSLENYDKENQSNYLETLESYIHHNGNTAHVGEELFIHRNTVNYRLKKIEELMDIKLSDMKVIAQYQVAFYIRRLLTAEQ
jgi:hypothetical protein